MLPEKPAEDYECDEQQGQDERCLDRRKRVVVSANSVCEGLEHVVVQSWVACDASLYKRLAWGSTVRMEALQIVQRALVPLDRSASVSSRPEPLFPAGSA